MAPLPPKRIHLKHGVGWYAVFTGGVLRSFPLFSQRNVSLGVDYDFDIRLWPPPNDMTFFRTYHGKPQLFLLLSDLICPRPVHYTHKPLKWAAAWSRGSHKKTHTTARVTPLSRPSPDFFLTSTSITWRYARISPPLPLTAGRCARSSWLLWLLSSCCWGFGPNGFFFFFFLFAEALRGGLCVPPPPNLQTDNPLPAEVPPIKFKRRAALSTSSPKPFNGNDPSLPPKVNDVNPTTSVPASLNVHDVGGPFP